MFTIGGGNNALTAETTDGPATATTTPQKEIVLLVAPPACGKSTFSRRFDPQVYTRVNQDTLKTLEKCMQVR